MIDTIPVELHPHSVHWAEMARAEIARLHEVLGGVLVTVHHIGSTSIPGIMAKPIVDLIPVVSDLDSLDRNMPLVEAIGYRCFGELGLPGRRYCRRNDPVTGKRAFQLHCYAEGSPEIDRHLAFANYLCSHPAIGKEIDRHLAFANYLCSHPAIGKEYEAEKIRAAALHPDNTLDYNAAKNDWIKRIEREALRWWGARG